MLKSAEGMLKSAGGGMLKSAEGMLKSAAHRTEREQKYTLNVKGTRASVSKTLTQAPCRAFVQHFMSHFPIILQKNFDL